MDEHPSQTPPDKPGMTGREIYNAVTDTVGGPNVRLRDNLLQLLAIVACTGFGVGIGLLIGTDPIGGALIGGFVGLLAGLFGSGVFLMIYRAVSHSRGRHD